MSYDEQIKFLNIDRSNDPDLNRHLTEIFQDIFANEGNALKSNEACYTSLDELSTDFSGLLGHVKGYLELTHHSTLPCIRGLELRKGEDDYSLHYHQKLRQSAAFNLQKYRGVIDERDLQNLEESFEGWNPLF